MKYIKIPNRLSIYDVRCSFSGHPPCIGDIEDSNGLQVNGFEISAQKVMRSGKSREQS